MMLYCCEWVRSLAKRWSSRPHKRPPCPSQKGSSVGTWHTENHVEIQRDSPCVVRRTMAFLSIIIH